MLQPIADLMAKPNPRCRRAYKSGGGWCSRWDGSGGGGGGNSGVGRGRGRRRRNRDEAVLETSLYFANKNRRHLCYNMLGGYFIF